MSKEAKLKKIIEKAKERGWNDKYHRAWRIEKPLHLLQDNDVILNTDSAVMIHFAPMVLFDKSFAKAIWGEESTMISELNNGEYTLSWQHHMMRAVISDDPIDYYYDNL